MPVATPTKTYTTKILKEGDVTGLEVPFDPIPVFGKVRPPVKVTLNGYTYRSTIAVMNGEMFLPLAKVHREAAGLTGEETLAVTLTLDTEKREVTPPADLAAALKKAGAWQQWREMSFTHQREWAEAVEDAKKPETRTRRIANAVAAVRARPRKASPSKRPTNKPAPKKSAARKSAAKKRARA